MSNSLACLLGRFEQAIQDDPDILGVMYTGSLGRGTADCFSDLDIEVWLTDPAFAAGQNRWLKVLGFLGEIRFAYPTDSFVQGFIGPEWHRVDLELRRRCDFEPDSKYVHATVIKDTDEVLARLIADSSEEEIAVTAEQVEQAISTAIDAQIYLTLHNARGAVWSAMSEISECGAELYEILALLRGRKSYGFRFVEQLLTPAEQTMLTAVWPTAPTRNENRRAARALWKWTQHVWAEAERVLGQVARIAIDEREFLQAIDAIYLRN